MEPINNFKVNQLVICKETYHFQFDFKSFQWNFSINPGEIFRVQSVTMFSMEINKPGKHSTVPARFFRSLTWWERFRFIINF